MRLIKSYLLPLCCLCSLLLLGSCTFNTSGACRADNSLITHWQQPDAGPCIYKHQGHYWVFLRRAVYKPKAEDILIPVLGGEGNAQWFGEQIQWNYKSHRDLFLRLPSGSKAQIDADQLAKLINKGPVTMDKSVFLNQQPQLVKGLRPALADSIINNKWSYLVLVKKPSQEHELLKQFPQFAGSAQAEHGFSYFRRSVPGLGTELMAGVLFVVIDVPGTAANLPLHLLFLWG